jgi:glycosyltransferase involved in cell wall biosynthesis
VPGKRVLFVIPSLERAGAERLVENVAIHLSCHSRWRIDVCTLKAGSKSPEQLTASGVRVHNLNWRHRYNVCQIRALRLLMRRTHYDIVHSHLFPADFATALARTDGATRFITTEHSEWNNRRASELLRPLDRWVYSRFDAIVAVSGMVRRALLRWIPEVDSKLSVIVNGIPVFPEDQEPDKTIDILCVAGLNRPAKGVDILLRAIPLIAADVNAVYIAGDGPLRTELTALRDQLGLATKVRFGGATDDVRALMRRARVLVLPSRWEGLPMVLLEGMEASMAIVATTVGGIPEAIEDRVSGLLVPPEDPEALAGGIGKLLTDRAFTSQLGKQARVVAVARYSVATHGERLLELYDRLGTSRCGEARRRPVMTA